MDLIFKRHASAIWLTLMFSTGLCSLVYELALAQLLGGLMGNALGRFATTLGFYVAGLGLGSILFKPSETKREGRAFVRAEMGLYALGFLSPFLFTVSYVIAFRFLQTDLIRYGFVLVITHSVIFVTGFLSGFELPILSSLAEREKIGASSSVLVADYGGMFVGSLLFPYWLFPSLGLLAAFWCATFLNLIAAVIAFYLTGEKSRSVLAVFLIFGILNLAGLYYSSALQAWLANLYVANS